MAQTRPVSLGCSPLGRPAQPKLSATVTASQKRAEAGRRSSGIVTYSELRSYGAAHVVRMNVMKEHPHLPRIYRMAFPSCVLVQIS